MWDGRGGRTVWHGIHPPFWGVHRVGWQAEEVATVGEAEAPCGMASGGGMASEGSRDGRGGTVWRGKRRRGYGEAVGRREVG